MDELRPDALAAAVAAWHNRHPLARRITPAQVQGIGWVALPFVQRPGAAPLSVPGGMPGVAPGPVPGVLPDPALPVRADRVADATAAVASATAAPAPDAPEVPEAPAASSPSARLLIAFKLGLRTALAAPRRLSASLQAARQRRAQVRLRAQALQPAFSEDFIAPIPPRRVARWALRHGQLHAHGAGLPVREVRPDAQWGRQDTGLVTLYLATAAVEAGSRRARVLLPAGSLEGISGVGAMGTALGPRLLSPSRAAAALGLAAAIGLGVAGPGVLSPTDWPGVASAQALLARWSAPAAGSAAQASAPQADDASTLASARSAASAAAAASPASATSAMSPGSAASTVASASSADAQIAAAGAEAPTLRAAASAASEAVVAPAVATAAPVAPAARPKDSARPTESTASVVLAQAGPPPATPTQHGAEPDGAATTLPPDDPPPAAPFQFEPFRPGQRLVRPLDEATKAAARQTVAALRAARGDPPPTAASPSTAAGALALAPDLARPQATDLGPEPGPAYALTTRPLRTRAESEQVLTAVRALLAQHTAEPLLVELMPAGDDWRVVCWPFSRRQDAQLARALLLTRGLRMDAVEF